MNPIDVVKVSSEIKTKLFRSLLESSHFSRESLAEAASVKVSAVRQCETALGRARIDKVEILFNYLGYHFILVCYDTRRRLDEAGYPRLNDPFTKEQWIETFAKILQLERWQVEAKLEELHAIPIELPKPPPSTSSPATPCLPASRRLKPPPRKRKGDVELN